MKHRKFSAWTSLCILCAMMGAFVPWYFNLKALKQYNTVMILPYYFAEGTATPLASSIATDFFIGIAPVLVWMCIQSKRGGLKHWRLLLPATFLVSFAFACSLFLLLREHKNINSFF